MALTTEKFRDYLEGEYPIDVIGIYINRSGIRIQYREQLGDEQIDRQLRKTHLYESAETFIKKAAYMDANLDRNSEMMMQLAAGNVDIAVQRVSHIPKINSSNEYRLRQDTVRNSDNLYIFATKYYHLSCKEEADVTAQTLKKYICSEEEKIYILEVQLLSATDHYSSMVRFHTKESYSAIMELDTLK